MRTPSRSSACSARRRRRGAGRLRGATGRTRSRRRQLRLPFCAPAAFARTWGASGVAPARGRFCRQLFGERDAGRRSAHDLPRASRSTLLAVRGRRLEELEEDGSTAGRNPEHWHLFHVVARAVPSLRPARRAYEVLRRVFEDDAYADRALRSAASDLDERDRALARRLAYGAVQRVRTLDHAIETLGGGPSRGSTRPSAPRSGSAPTSSATSTACRATPP